MATFRKHIEDQLEPGMTWDNHSVFGWHLDHKVPLEYGNPSPQEVLSRLRYTNVQPLWAKHNWQKRNLFTEEPQVVAALSDDDVLLAFGLVADGHK